MIEIIKSVGEFTLRKITSKTDIGGHTYTGTRYEIWTDPVKMEQGIAGDGQYIYCRGFSGSPEHEVIDIFDRTIS